MDFPNACLKLLTAQENGNKGTEIFSVQKVQ
jgi:hypothetical protein